MTANDETKNSASFFDPDAVEAESLKITQYDITSEPNDFNVMTLFSYMERGAIELPPFQRYFVWDKQRASRFIESLIKGLPVPQIFLYQESRNNFQIIDGQQRMMSVYYFMKGRFPKPDGRARLREIFAEHKSIPDRFLADDELFQDFSLALKSKDESYENPLHGLKFDTLDEHKTPFELRPIRVVIIKQNEPKDDNSSIYEIYDRLNTGGANLKPQEIRANLYYSDFYRALYEANKNPAWRKIIGQQAEDAFMRDVELLLRAFAMLVKGDEYKPSMTRFLNTFSNFAKLHMTSKDIKRLIHIFDAFVRATSTFESNVFHSPTAQRFSIALFEAAFVGWCTDAWKSSNENPSVPSPSQKDLSALTSDPAFRKFLQEGTTKSANVQERLKIARDMLNANQRTDEH